MPEQEAPYDPYIPSGQAGAQQQQGTGGNARTQALQAVSFFPNDFIDAMVLFSGGYGLRHLAAKVIDDG